MKVDIKGYTPEYRKGVIACLKRNYEWMSHTTDEKVYAWARPMFEYEWAEPLPEKVQPYRHGLVLLAGDKVVGYLGFIFSLRRFDGRRYLYQTGTTWAIDEGYRIYMFKALKLAYSLPDVMGDFTPRKSVEETLVKVFKFQYAARRRYRFYPVPVWHSRLTCRLVGKAGDIQDPVVQEIFRDHEGYPVKCMAFRRGEKECYVFYIVRSRGKKRMLLAGGSNLVTIAGFSERDFASAHFREIIWKLQKAEDGCVEAGENFLPEKWSHPRVKKADTAYLVRYKDPAVEPAPDLLYSEMVMLDLHNHP